MKLYLVRCIESNAYLFPNNTFVLTTVAYPKPISLKDALFGQIKHLRIVPMGSRLWVFINKQMLRMRVKDGWVQGLSSNGVTIREVEEGVEVY